MDDTLNDGLTKAADIPREGGNYHCRSVEEAVAPPELVKAAVKHAKTVPEGDGFYHFEVMPVCGNLVLKVTAKPRGYFVARPTEYGDRRAETEQQQEGGIKVLTRSLDKLKIHSRYYAQIHVYRWDRMLYAWGEKDRVYIRAVPTPEDWFENKVSEVQKAIIMFSTGRNPAGFVSRANYLEAVRLWESFTGHAPKVA